MSISIKNKYDYINCFCGAPSDRKLRTAALATAHDIRKFEIELYWKRATYFWTLIAATFAGYFALSSSSSKPELILLISCMGFILSTGWYLVNRGSKFWQENWEGHVNILEDEIMGPLYKTIISEKEYHFFKFWSGYPYSVSKINQLISLFVTVIWFGLVIYSFIHCVACPYMATLWPCLLLGAVTMLFFIGLLWLGRSTLHCDLKEIHMNRREFIEKKAKDYT